MDNTEQNQQQQDIVQHEIAVSSKKRIGFIQFKNELRRLKNASIGSIGDMGRKIEELVAKADFTTSSYADPFNSTVYTEKDDQIQRKSGKLPEKEFMIRNSVLTDLFTCKHIQTIENIVVASLVVWMLSTACSDFLDNKTLTAVFPGSELVKKAFANYDIAIILWLKMITAMMLFYAITYFWSLERENRRILSTNQFDRLSMFCYYFYQVGMITIPFQALFIDKQLGSAAATALAVEQLRLMMKMHSFGREVWKKMRRDSECQEKKADENNKTTNSTFPGFSQYLYFLFAPTLIYRDVYPHKDLVDWNFVVSNFAQFVAGLLFLYYLMARLLQSIFDKYPPENVSFRTILTLAFSCTLPATTFIFASFFVFQHSWLNAWAEMLGFGDRLFYKDWWNVASFGEYYRTWNCVTHNWFYTYVFKDAQEIFNCPKFIAAFLVFVVSSTCHEYVIIAMTQFFFPFLLLQLSGPAFLFAMVKSRGRLASVGFWMSFAFGLGLVTSLYWFEISARAICQPAYNDFFWDTLIPRFITCKKT